jgi:hypothetical protein
MKKSELLETLAKYEAAFDLLDYKVRKELEAGRSGILNKDEINEVFVVADLPTISEE